MCWCRKKNATRVHRAIKKVILYCHHSKLSKGLYSFLIIIYLSHTWVLSNKYSKNWRVPKIVPSKREYNQKIGSASPKNASHNFKLMFIILTHMWLYCTAKRPLNSNKFIYPSTLEADKTCQFIVLCRYPHNRSNHHSVVNRVTKWGAGIVKCVCVCL